MESQDSGSQYLSLKRLFPQRASLDIREEGPEPRSDHTMAVSPDGRIWIFGGLDYASNVAERMMDSFPLHRDLWTYDLRRGIWEAYDQPYALIGCTSTVHDGEFVIVGGTEFPISYNISHRICKFNVTDNNLRLSRVLGPRACGHAMVKVGNDLYIFGGSSGRHTLSRRMRKFSLETNGGGVLLDDRNGPSARCDHGMATDGEEIFIFGGANMTGLLDLTVIWAYNIAGNRWTAYNSLPDPIYGRPAIRRFHTVEKYFNYAFIIGGAGENNQKFNDIWMFDMTNKQWLLLNITLRRPVYSHASCISQDGICYIFGGVIHGRWNMSSRALYKINLKAHCIKRIMQSLVPPQEVSQLTTERKQAIKRKKNSQPCTDAKKPRMDIPIPVYNMTRLS